MKVGVHGGDITGLVVAHIFKRAGHSVSIAERSAIPGRSALLPRFKYLERSKEVQGLLDDLGVFYGEYALASGVMLHGQVVQCRDNLTESVQHAYWRKTRLVSAPTGEVKGVTDPEVGPKRKAISLDWVGIRAPLIREFQVLRQHAETGFDLEIETRPLWETPFVSGIDAMAVALNMVRVKSVRDVFLNWDVVYTPFTPADCVHRIYHYGDDFICEFSGAMDEDRLASDLNFLFPGGWYVDGEAETAYGHILPLASQPVWPAGVYPIGRLAQWDERVTMTRVIRDATTIARNAHP